MKETIFDPVIIALTISAILCCLDIMFGQKEKKIYCPNSRNFLEGYPDLVITYDKLLATDKNSDYDYNEFLKIILDNDILLSVNEAIYILNSFNNRKSKLTYWNLFVEHCGRCINIQIDPDKTDRLIKIYG